MYIVSNTTPIIALLKINKIELLEALFNKIIIPEAVYNEVVCKNSEQDEIKQFIKCKFIKKKTVKNELAVKLMRNQVGLDAGESEAIVLADENKESILIMDELKGRRVALEMGLKVTGTLGILLKAKQKGLVKSLKPLLDEMIEKNIRIGSNLYKDILKEAEEM